MNKRKEEGNMAIRITDLRIDPKSLGQTMLLADISPVYE